MKYSVKKRIQAIMLIILFIAVYYGFLFDIMISAKTTIINVMQSHNMTTIDYTIKEYNATNNTWVEKPKQLDITGLIDIIMTLIIVFAPIIVIVVYLYP